MKFTKPLPAVVVIFALSLVGCSSNTKTSASDTVSSTIDVLTTELTVTTETVVSDPTVASPTDSTRLGTQLAPSKKRPPFVLTAKGVDKIVFGDDFTKVKAVLVAVHGVPDDESDWAPQQSPCEGLGTKSRTLTWGNVVLAFSDGPTEFGPAGTDHFISYYSGDEIDANGAVVSDNKILLDQTVASLKARFPGMTIANNEIAGPEFTLPGGIQGSLTGLADTDTTQSFRAGLICID